MTRWIFPALHFGVVYSMNGCSLLRAERRLSSSCAAALFEIGCQLVVAVFGNMPVSHLTGVLDGSQFWMHVLSSGFRSIESDQKIPLRIAHNPQHEVQR